MTLAESLVSMVIVGVMVVAALNLTASAVQGRQLRATRAQGKNLAIDLMWEIMAGTYEEHDNIIVDQRLEHSNGAVVETPDPQIEQPPVFGPEPGEDGGTREYFDDIDDYNGWSSTPPQIKDGTVIPGYDGWSRSVDVKFSRLDDPKSISVSETGIKRILVTVTDPRGRIEQVVAVRSRGGTFDQTPTHKSDFVSWIGIELQTSGSPRAVMGGAGSINLPEGE